MPFLKSLALTTLLIPTQAMADQVTAYKTPAFINNSPADHTYVRTQNACYAVIASGVQSACSGGRYVVGSSVRDAGPLSCYHRCRFRYLRDGVCHQHSNRMMSHTGMTLNTSVRLYRFTVDLFGVYGRNWRQCQNTCN